MIPRTAVRYGRARFWVCGAGVALLGSSLFPGAAAADPVADRQAQARAVAAQIEVLGRRDATLSEQYDRSVLEVQAAQANLARTVSLAAQADADANQARSLLTVDAVDAYVHGGRATRGSGEAVDAQATILRAEYGQTLASTQRDHVDQFRAAAGEAKSAAANLDAARRQATAKVSQLNSARNATVTSERLLQDTLGQVKGDIAVQVAQIDAAKQADQARQLLASQQLAVTAASSAGPPTSPAGPPTASPVAAARTPVLSTAPGPTSTAPAPPGAPSGGAGAAAVAAAMTRLGLPYVWAASGPDSFDCSGLTMWAWAHAGVSLPHFSGAQYASTTHISMADLQPGDLVFESDPGAHVAMYIGGGKIIAAPHSGTVVQIQSLSGGYVLASRP